MTNNELLDMVLNCEIIGGNVPRERCENCAYCINNICRSDLLLVELILLVKRQEEEIERLEQLVGDGK